ncbi:MAG TPA: serine protease [Byssovorax sp.]
MTTSRRAASDVAASVRRSIVGVRARTASGTGWVALANDLIVTSQTAVGYELDVSVELEGGARHAARVIWADVPRDLAVVLPAERLSLPPLVMRPDLPRIAEVCYLLGAQPGQPFRITPTIVSAVDFRVGATRCFEIDAGFASPGAPVVDGDGHIIGVSGLDLPRGERVARVKAIALPVAALQRALSVFDVPPPQLASRMPTYRCPACAEPYGFELARCAACGRTLPHAWEAEPEFAVGERLVRDVLKRLSALPTTVRRGPRTFVAAIPPDTDAEEMADVTLTIDLDGEAFGASVPIARLPGPHVEAFLRLLLTLNDQLPHNFRLALAHDVVSMCFGEACARASGADAATLVRELLRLGARYRRTFGETFDAKPITPDA